MGGTRDVKEVLKTSLGKSLTDKLHYGINVAEVAEFLKYVKRENKRLGRKIGYNWDRVRGRKTETSKKPEKKWTVKSLNQTVLQKNGIYIIWCKARPNNASKIVQGRKILEIYKDVSLTATEKLTSSIEDFSKKAKGDKIPDHGISILSDGTLNQTFIYDNGTTNKVGKVPFTVKNLSDKVCDLTDCFYFNIFKK